MSTRIENFERLSKSLRARLVITAQAAEFLRCSKQKLNNDRWLSRGCPYYKLNGKIYYDFYDLKKFFKDRMQKIVPSA